MLIEAKNLRKYFKNGRVKAVDDVSFSIEKGRTLGVVGESGCGKSTLAKLVVELLEPDSGEILWEGKTRQIIFQQPFLSLDPRMTVSDILKEPFLIHSVKNKVFLERKVIELLGLVDLNPSFLNRLPRFLSGGECQRVAIARALAVEPELLVCDEAVSSLDVISQIQILNLLLRLQREKGMAYLFISHDPKVVRHMSDEILVMK